jgi:hypothetical protein
MKSMKLVIIAAIGCISVAFLSGSANAQLLEIIDDYCTEVAQGADEAADELNEANGDLEDCAVEYEDCLGGFIDRDPVECIGDYKRCLRNGTRDRTQACNSFLAEFSRDTRTAERRADRQDVEDEFLAFLYSESGQECLAPAIVTGFVCAALPSD